MDKQEASVRPVTASAIVTVDLVIVRMLDSFGPELLLVQRAKYPFAGWWSLPGGKLADEDQTLEAAAVRELREETGFMLPSSLQLQQLYTSGDRWRDPRSGRWISVAFCAPVISLSHWQEVSRPLCAGDDARDARWWCVYDLPELAFDHKDIVKRAFASEALPLDRRFC